MRRPFAQIIESRRWNRGRVVVVRHVVIRVHPQEPVQQFASGLSAAPQPQNNNDVHNDHQRDKEREDDAPRALSGSV